MRVGGTARRFANRDESVAYFRTFNDALATVPGVVSRGAVSSLPFTSSVGWGSINVDSPDKNIAKTQLFAFDAQTLQTLWHSRQNQARDEIGTWGKFAYPTIAGGKVFIANADAQLKVYGLLH